MQDRNPSNWGPKSAPFPMAKVMYFSNSVLKNPQLILILYSRDSFPKQLKNLHFSKRGGLNI